MTSAPDKLDDRTVFYKHDDSNFYPALSYLLGQALALIPQMLIDVLLFGTCVYWMVGFVATAQVSHLCEYRSGVIFQKLLSHNVFTGISVVFSAIFLLQLHYGPGFWVVGICGS